MKRPAKRRIIIRLSRREPSAKRAPAKLQTHTRPARRETVGSPEEAPSRFVRFLFGIYAVAIIWTSLGYATNGVAGSPVSRSRSLLRWYPAASSVSDVPAYIQSAARAAGVDPSVAEWIVAHESQHHPDATGDGGESRGIWQINRLYHPEVSDDCAYDMECSTDWSLQRIRDGYVSEWSTWKYCHAWFDDCPF